MRLLLTSLPLVALSLLLAPTEADACSLGPESVIWSLPSAGESILPETPILVAIEGEPFDNAREVTLLHEGDEVVADLELAGRHGLFSNVYILRPEGALIDGAYELQITYDDSQYSDDFFLSFAVDQTLDPGPDPGPVDFEWYRHTLTVPSGDTCYSANAMQFMQVEPLQPAPHYYEMLFQRTEGQGPVPVLARGEDLDDLFRVYIPNAECIAVRGIGFNGVEGDVVEVCFPDKCVTSDNTESYVNLGDVDWDAVEGCSENIAPPPGEDPYYHRDDEDDDDAPRRGCSSTGGSSPTGLSLLLLLGLIALRRGHRS